MWRPLLTLSALVISAPLFALEVPQAPHLVVSGYAEQKAEPDMLTLNVSVTALEKQGIKAKQQVDGKVAAFFGQLEGLGIKRTDVEAGNLVISPEYQYPQNKKPELVGYRAQRQLAVKLYQLDKLSELMDTALKAGLESVSQIEYGLKAPQAMKEQARLGAVEDARSKAESLAKAFGMKLGKVYSVEYRNNTPMPIYSRALKAAAMSPAADMMENSYQQQQISITDNVEAVFLLE
ncbi:SIMPL domain-containing protein [Aeromonas dhakensis]|uniref:SIMPL domain-containing protein n=1 Tax=Aeromonas dhakensis TaxID=196024 RepID=UPI0003A28C93|nr:SIMPL domain-containing protein [Aeromonas dhakensis]MBL0675828.1 SIMPL domain-containing protein [Aeromonas dhakensis]MDX7743676.1 SIMPL domain-containing protein [Aeromonas dhakensis]WAF99280.1 SIMPL domain-containing protein [Aeromonas dhakensis]CAB5676616.1 26 kDa periplasmic immunogenic protein precursor [Aeromonas hydrophila]